jgi:hypothetical protein
MNTTAFRVGQCYLPGDADGRAARIRLKDSILVPSYLENLCHLELPLLLEAWMQP